MWSVKHDLGPSYPQLGRSRGLRIPLEKPEVVASDVASLRIPIGDQEEVSGELRMPEDAVYLLVYAHGAGAGMHHAFMEASAQKLAQRRIATLRFQFPYMEAGKKLPDRPPRLLPAIAAAVKVARERFPDLPLAAAGKSMGGRMSSHAVAEGLIDVRALVFFGFPLHPSGKPGRARAEHLSHIEVPMLFLQGTRDKLADLPLIREVAGGLASATLHVVEGADHGFHVLKRSGRTDDEVLEELCQATADFLLHA